MSSLAQQTLAIIRKGAYTLSSGEVVDIEPDVDYALNHTVLYTPEQLESMWPAPGLGEPPNVEITGETTTAAAIRVTRQSSEKVLALVFASAKNPGGGFEGSAKAQEEDLARQSALVPCQRTAFGYYEANRTCSSKLYTDHCIYSPQVPFFRDDSGALIPKFLLSTVTAPAPNVGALDSKDTRYVDDTLRRRAGYILSIAAHHQYRTLILGAWGCGVFHNSPERVAAVWDDWLRSPHFVGKFDRVIFAVYERGKVKPNQRAFFQRWPQ